MLPQILSLSLKISELEFFCHPMGTPVAGNPNWNNQIELSPRAFYCQNYIITWKQCPCYAPISTTLHGVLADVTRLAREYTCACWVIKLQEECCCGPGERPLCVGPGGATETSHCKPGQRRACAYCQGLLCMVTDRSGRGEWLSLTEHAQEVGKGESVSAGSHWL